MRIAANTYWTGTLIVLLGGLAVPDGLAANGWPRGMVRAQVVAVFERADAASSVVARLDPHATLQIVEVTGEWTKVQVANLSDHGWVRTEGIVVSPGVLRFWQPRESAASIPLLRSEIAAESDSRVRSWLQFYLGYAHWDVGERDRAIAVFEELVRGTDGWFKPFAFIALAKLHAANDDIARAIDAYQGLLLLQPDFSLPSDGFIPLEITTYPNPLSTVLRGSRAIQYRIRLLDEVVTARSELARFETAGSIPVEAIAEARLRLARAEHDRALAEPCLPRGEGAVNMDVPRRLFQQVLEASPRGAAAGHAAFRLIELSEPYEWEGFWRARAEWQLERYGAFIADFPDHELVAQAIYETAVATWAKGGYPEVYGYMFGRSRDELASASANFARWFPERGWGVTPDLPGRDTTHAREAARLFRRIIEEHPTSPAAPLATYWLGVIHDFVFGETALALPFYRAFIGSGADATFAQKAQERIRALGGADFIRDRLTSSTRRTH